MLDQYTQTNPRGCSCAVRLVNTLYDIRPMRVSPLMEHHTLERYVQDMFADTYSDLASYDLRMYVDKQLRFGIYGVLVLSPQDIYEGALVTVVPCRAVPRAVPKCSYDYKVSHMVHSRSRFVESNRFS